MAPTHCPRRVHLHDRLRSVCGIRRQAYRGAAGEPPVADGVRISIGMREPQQNHREQEHPFRTATIGGSLALLGQDELLNAPVFRLQWGHFSDVQIPLRIGGHVVERAEFSRR